MPGILKKQMHKSKGNNTISHPESQQNSRTPDSVL